MKVPRMEQLRMLAVLVKGRTASKAPRAKAETVIQYKEVLAKPTVFRGGK